MLAWMEARLRACGPEATLFERGFGTQSHAHGYGHLGAGHGGGSCCHGSGSQPSRATRKALARQMAAGGCREGPWAYMGIQCKLAFGTRSVHFWC